MKRETEYNKVVNFDKERGEITVLDYIFECADGFKGAVGSTFYPVSKSYYKVQTTLSSIEDRLRDSVGEEEVPLEYVEHERGIYKNPYRRWAKDIVDLEQQQEMMFDTSYEELWDYMREELKLSDSEAYIFECSGGGRCFRSDFEGNYNIHLSELIRKAETKDEISL